MSYFIIVIIPDHINTDSHVPFSPKNRQAVYITAGRFKQYIQ